MNEPNNTPRKPAYLSLYAAIKSGRRKVVRNISFVRCPVLRADTNYTFDNCSFPDIDAPVVVESVFMDCDFTRAGLDNAVFVNCTFRKCDFKGDVVTGDFIDCGFDHCDFTDVVHRQMRIRGGCSFRNCTGLDLQAPQYRALPVGQFIAYKRVHGAVLELLVSKKAQRVSAPSNNERKYRVSKVKVKRALHDDGSEIRGPTKFSSLWTSSFIYTVGEWAEEPDFDPAPAAICTRGIHIFLTFEEARDYR